jgi:tRNA(fMet)-specific endonuclease VapC
MLCYLLDTNILIYTIKNRPTQVRDRFMQNDGRMAISTVTLGELVFGTERSAKPQENLAVVESLLARIELLPYDEAAAYHFGQIRADLFRRGQPIGPFDMMIAAHARSRGFVLVTNNIREYARVSGLRVENWASA